MSELRHQAARRTAQRLTSELDPQLAQKLEVVLAGGDPPERYEPLSLALASLIVELIEADRATTRRYSSSPRGSGP